MARSRKAPAQTETGNEQAETNGEHKAAYQPRSARFVDHEAGVKLRTDFQNKLQTIALRDDPSAAAVGKLAEKGYRFDGDMGVFFKPIKDYAPRASAEEAEQAALEVANQIRTEKGLPLKQEYRISRESHAR